MQALVLLFVSHVTSLFPFAFDYRVSDAHRDFAHHKHENVPDNDSVEGLSQCALNQVVRTDLVYKELVRRDASDPPAPWIPYRVKSRWEPLEGCSWATEYESALAAYEAPDRLGPSLRQATDSLSFAQTILWALEKLNPDDAWTRKEILTVHVRFPASLSIMCVNARYISSWVLLAPKLGKRWCSRRSCIAFQK